MTDTVQRRVSHETYVGKDNTVYCRHCGASTYAMTEGVYNALPCVYPNDYRRGASGAEIKLLAAQVSAYQEARKAYQTCLKLVENAQIAEDWVWGDDGDEFMVVDWENTIIPISQAIDAAARKHIGTIFDTEDTNGNGC